MSADRASVVLKWPLLINDAEQDIGGGPVALVAMQGQTRGLGAHVGSVVAPPFVWHVFEVSA